VSDLLHLCEQIRDVVSSQGWSGCFRKSVFAYHQKTKLPIPGLWSAVESAVVGHDLNKVMIKLQKTWGGSPIQWVKWMQIVKQRPDC
jgi:hypothetical protein